MPSQPPSDPRKPEPGGPGEPAPSRHPIREQDLLWKNFIDFAGSVVEALEKSVTAVTESRFELVPEVETDEVETDRREVEIEQDCLRILALYEPVATDLRRMATILKVNRDWERIADLALRVARRARKLATRSNGVVLPDAMKQLARDVLAQVRSSQQALAARDADAARAVIAGDRGIDVQYRSLRKQFRQMLSQHPEQLAGWLLLLNMARNFERIADHATGIAQTVVYLQEGKIIRHTPEAKPAG